MPVLSLEIDTRYLLLFYLLRSAESFSCFFSEVSICFLLDLIRFFEGMGLDSRWDFPSPPSLSCFDAAAVISLWSLLSF